MHGFPVIFNSYKPLVITSPSQLSGLSLWYDMADTASITSAANLVSQINDKATLGPYHATQGVGASQPLTNTNTINGKNVLTFDGVDDSLISNGAALNYGASTVISIAKPNVTTAGIHILANNGGGGTRYNIQNWRIDFANATLATATPTVGVPVAQVSRVDAPGAAATQYIKTNTLAQASGVAVRTGLSAGLRVGATGGGAAFWSGDIAEICNWQRMLTDAEVNSIMNNYFVPKWGVAWSNL